MNLRATQEKYPNKGVNHNELKMSYLPVGTEPKYYTQYSQGKTRGQGTWPKKKA